MLAHSRINILTWLAALMQTQEGQQDPEGRATEVPASSEG